MRRTALIVLAAAGGVCILLLIAAAVVVATVDLRTIVGPVQARVKAATGRELVIAGPIDLRLSLEPKIVLNDVTFGNASWGATKDMVRARRVEAQVALLPLIERRFELVELTWTDPVIALETDAQGRGNWEFDGAAASPSSSAASTGAAAAGVLGIGTVVVDNGALTYRDGASGKITRIAIERLIVRTRGGDAPVDAEFRGKVDDVALAFTGNLGPLDAIRVGRWPYPLSAKGQVDQKPASVNAKLSVGPDTIVLDELEIALGAFNAKGRLSIVTGEHRRRYVFALTIPSVALNDLPVPVRASTTAQAPAGKGAGSRYIFSETRLPLDALKSFDADGQLTIAELRVDERVKLAPLEAQLTLRSGKLDASRLVAGVFSGTVNGSLVLDASRADAPKVALKVDGQNLDLGAILAAAGTPRQTHGGKTTLSIDVTAAGESPHAWASSASGNARAVVGPTTLINTKVDFDHVFDKLGEAVNPFREVDPSTELQCAVVRLPLAGGVARIDRSIAMETKKVGVTASGTLDFRNETLDLSLRPRIKQGIPLDVPQFAELVRFTGPFREPRVSIDAVASAETIAKIGAAIGTDGLSVLGTTLLQRATDTENACDVALGRKPVRSASTGAASKTPAAPAAALPHEIGRALGKLLGR
jgi:AsmA family protein